MIKDSEKVVFIMLNAIKSMNAGKGKLAQFLKGSKSKEVFQIEDKTLYGGLYWFNIYEIEDFVEQLERMELVKRRIIKGYRFDYPVLELSEAGKKVLEDKIPITLMQTKREPQIGIGQSEKLTYELFKEGKQIPNIAKERNLAMSTIYGHFYRLVINKYLSSSNFIGKERIQQIIETRNKFEAKPTLKQLKEALPQDIFYDEIRCVLAEFDKFRGDKNENLV